MSVESDIGEDANFFIGEDKRPQFDVVNIDGTPQTMTGWALEFSIRKSRGHPTEVLSKTTGAAQITIGNGAGTNDRATVIIDDTDTISLPPRTYYYSIWRTDAGNEQILAFGRLVLRLPVARAAGL